MKHFEHIEAGADAFARGLPKLPAIELSPLQLLLGSALWQQFMFMGFAEQGALRLYIHRHGMTRRTIAVSEDLRTWQFQADNTWAPVPLASALSYVLDGAELLGAFPGVPYDEKYRRERDARLAAE